MTACGGEYTVVVTEDSEVLAFGTGNYGQLGLGKKENQLLLIRHTRPYVPTSHVLLSTTSSLPLLYTS